MKLQKDLQFNWQLINTPAAYQAALDELRSTAGPIAIDTERASGYTYYQNAYLVQIKRGNGTIFLFDPIALPMLDELANIINSQLWILHSGRHDLPCLAELGLFPHELWDTELAARILGANRFGLGSLVADTFQVQLDKAYSGVNWSLRPLENAWLEYAAIDVEFLTPLMQHQTLLAVKAEKRNILAQEFAALKNWQPKESPKEPWRKVSHINTLGKDNRALALVRELWYARDTLAQNANLAAHLILSDAAIINAATIKPRSIAQLQKLEGFRSPNAQAHLTVFWRAIMQGKRTTENLLRTPAVKPGEFSNLLLKQDSKAKSRLQCARATVAKLATALNVPSEQLLEAAVIKKLIADPPPKYTSAAIAAKLRSAGARNWQIEAVSAQLAADLQQLAEPQNT